MYLVVTQAFDAHARGDAITDEQEIAAVMASDHSAHVVTVYTTPDEENH
jgi:hypothetical protein